MVAGLASFEGLSYRSAENDKDRYYAHSFEDPYQVVSHDNIKQIYASKCILNFCCIKKNIFQQIHFQTYHLVLSSPNLFQPKNYFHNGSPQHFMKHPVPVGLFLFVMAAFYD